MSSDETSTLPAEPAAQAGSEAQQVASATGLVSLLVLLSRGLGFVRDAIIAAMYGQGWQVDAYRYGFQIPDMLWMLIAGGVMYAAYVPVVTAYLKKGEEEKAWRTFSVIATFLFCVLSVVIPLCWIFAEPLLSRVLAPNLQPQTLELAVQLTRIVLPAQYCFFIGSLMMGMLQAKKRFLVPMLGPVIYNLGIIGGGLLGSRWLGIAAFSWGALAGALVGNLLLQMWALRGIGARFRPSLELGHEGVRRCGRLALPVIFGISLPQVDSTINGIVIASVTGGRAILENTNRLMQLPLGIVGQALGIAILPTLSEQAAADDLDEFRAMVNFGVRMALYLTVPLSVILMVLARPVIAVVFERGAFGPLDTQHAVPSMVLYAIGVGAYAAQAVVARAFYARHDTWTPVLSGSFITLAFFVPLNFGLFHLLKDASQPWLATRGPALATALGAIANFSLLFYLLHRRLGGLGLHRILGSGLRIAVACLALAAFAAGASYWFHDQLAVGRRGALLEVLVGGGGGLLLYGLITRALGSEEAIQAQQMIARRLPRKRLKKR